MHNLDRDAYKEHQEAKEDADFKYQYNQRLQAHDFKHQMHIKTFDEFNSRLEQLEVNSKIKNQGIEEKLSKFIYEQNKINQALIADVHQIEKHLIALVDEMRAKVNIKDAQRTFEEMQNWITTLSEENKQFFAESQENLQHLSHHFSGKLEMVKQELMDRPTGVDHIRKVCDDKLNDMALTIDSAIDRFTQAHKHLKVVDKKYTILCKMMNVQEGEA